MATTLMTSEPLFYGETPYNKKGIKAEDFITRLDSWATTQEWTQEVKTAAAVGYMRDDAAAYFQFILQCQDVAAFTEIKDGNYATFERIFKKQYFTVRTTMDLSADWSKMKQRPTEKAYQFAGRVGGIMVQYSSLLPAMPLSVERHERIHETLDGNPDALRAMWVAIDAVIEEQTREAQEAAYYDLGFKILATGMKSQSLIAKVRAQERAGLEYGLIMDFLEKEEANMGEGAKPMDNAPAKSHIPDVSGKVNEIADEVDENGFTYEQSVEALNSKFRRGPGKPNGGSGNGNSNGRGRGRGRGKPNQNQSQNPGKPAAQVQSQHTNGARPKYENRQPPGACNVCKQLGHWQKDCPKAQQFAKFMEANPTVHTVQESKGGPGVDREYQQYLEFKHGNRIASLNTPFQGDDYESMAFYKKNSGKEQPEM
jgi:hypothetical protein